MQILHLKYFYWKSYHLICYFCRVTIEGKPEPKDFSIDFGWPCRVCDNGIPAIYGWFVGVNESMWGCLSGAITLILTLIPPKWVLDDLRQECFSPGFSGIITSIFLGPLTEQDPRSHLILSRPVPQSLLCRPSQLVIYWTLSRDRELNLLRRCIPFLESSNC